MQVHPWVQGDGVVQCFLCSTFAGTTQFELQNHLQNVHRVTRLDVTALPRYSEADNIAEGVPCSFCSSYSGNTWPKMVDHLKNVHHVARSQVSDTYLGRQAKFELNEKARTLYKKKKLRCCCCQHGEFQDLTFKFRK